MSKLRGGKSSTSTPEALSPYSNPTHSEPDKLSPYSTSHSDDEMMIYDLDKEGLESYSVPTQESNKLAPYEINDQDRQSPPAPNKLPAYGETEALETYGAPDTHLEAYGEPEPQAAYATPEGAHLEAYNAPSHEQNELGSYSDQAHEPKDLTPYSEHEPESNLSPYNDKAQDHGELPPYSDHTQHSNPLGSYSTTSHEQTVNTLTSAQNASNKVPRPKSAFMENMRSAMNKMKDSFPIKDGKYDPNCVPVRLRDHMLADNYLKEVGQQKFDLPITGKDGKTTVKEVSIPKLTDKEREERKVTYDKKTGLLMKGSVKASTIGQKAKGIQDLQSFVMTKPEGKNADGADKEVGDIFLFNHYDLLKDNRMISHGAVAGEKPAEMAGALEIVNGKIEAITNYSGHYAPSDLDMYRFINTVNEHMPGSISEHCLIKLEGRASSPNVADFMKAMEKLESNGKPRHENLLEARIKNHNSRPLATKPLPKTPEIAEAPMPLSNGLARQHTATPDDIAKAGRTSPPPPRSAWQYTSAEEDVTKATEKAVRAEQNERPTPKPRTHTMVAAMKAFATVASKNTISPRSGIAGAPQRAGSLDR